MAKNGLCYLLSLTALTACAYDSCMAVMTIRDLDDEVRDKLRVRAAQNKRSMEAEARAILTEAVENVTKRTLLEILEDFGDTLRREGVVLEIPERSDPPRDPFT